MDNIKKKKLSRDISNIISNIRHPSIGNYKIIIKDNINKEYMMSVIKKAL